jgi:predicted O-methyltransferase YrrM
VFAARNIKRAGLSRRVRTLPGDIRRRLPTGYDVIMFCDIGPVSLKLLRNTHKSLPAGGLIVVVDRYLSDDRSKPLDRLVAQFVGASFLQATRSDIGFITGTKPAIGSE